MQFIRIKINQKVRETLIITSFTLPDTIFAGHIIVSGRQADKFHIFTREGTALNPYEHSEVRVIKVAAVESDGSEVTAMPLNDTFRNGLFMAMSNNRTFQYYRWEDLIGIN